jgi:hypothetical protein
MSFRRRAGIVGVLSVMALAAYGTARYFSDSLVFYVVEQSLLQKAPPGMDPTMIRARFRTLLSNIPDRNARLARALAISQSVERVQTLAPTELEQLLSVTPETARRGTF